MSDSPPLKGRGGRAHSRPARGRRAITRREFLGGSLALAGGTALASADWHLEATESTPRPDVAAATILDGLVVSVRATGPARIKLRAWPLDDPDAVRESPWQPTNAADAAHIVLPDAGTPGRRWAWQGVVQDPRGRRAPVADVIRTLPAGPAPGEASAFTFAFGSCMVLNRRTPALRVAQAAEPQFFAMLGDMGYQDDPARFPDTQNYAGYLAMFRDAFAHPDMTPVLATMPFYGVQDDHDYGLNDCWRENFKHYAARAYADLVPGVAWPGPDYRRWSIGEVDFFLTDNRRYKDPPTPPWENGRYMSVLGDTQRTWLLGGLAASTAQLKVVFIPMTMTWYWSMGEAQDVRSFINGNVSGTVIFLSGDKHAGAFCRFADRIWEMLASPLHNPNKHRTPARDGVIWTENGTDVALWNVVGLVDVDTLTSQTVTLRLMRANGVELHREVVSLAHG